MISFQKMLIQCFVWHILFLQVFLYVEDKQITGCCVAEPVHEVGPLFIKVLSQFDVARKHLNICALTQCNQHG